MKELLNMKSSENNWLIENIIPKNGRTMIYADYASFKTFLLLDIVKSVSSGNPLFNNFKTIKSNVLIIDEENGVSEMKKRCKQLGFTEDLNVYFIERESFKLDTKDHVDEVVNIIKEKDIGLVCFDSFVRMHDNDENSARDMAKIFNNGFEQIIKSTSASILFLHHIAKNTNPYSKTTPRGSSDFNGYVDISISIKSKDNLINFEFDKTRGIKKPESFKLLVVDDVDNNISFEYSKSIQNDKKQDDILTSEIINIIKTNQNIDRDQITSILKEKKINHSKAKFNQVMAFLDQEKYISVESGIKNKKRYKYNNESDVESEVD